MARKVYADSVVGKVVSTNRLGYTVNGNPMMSVTIADWEGDTYTYRISNDAALVYEIYDCSFWHNAHEFDLTPAGRISGYFRKV